MKLVIDTNIVHEDFTLRGARISKLCSASPRLGYDLMIPEVVCDEIINQYRKKLISNLSGYYSVVKMMDEIKSETKTTFDRDAFVTKTISEYTSYLYTRLKTIGINVIPYPIVDVKKLVNKDLYLKKPFKEVKEETVGFRDSLIWESVKSVCTPSRMLLEDPQVVFLTENTRDFADSNNELHPELITELRDSHLPENCVLLIPDVDAFFREKVDVELEELDNIRTALLKLGKYNRLNLQQLLKERLNDSFYEEYLFKIDTASRRFVHLPSYCEDPSINLIFDPVIDDISVRRLSDQKVLIEANANAWVDIFFFIFAPDYDLLDSNRKPTIIDDQLNEYYYLVESSVNVQLSVTIQASAKIGKVLSSDIRITNVVI